MTSSPGRPGGRWPGSARRLQSFLVHPDPQFVQAAISGLGRSGQKKYQPVLLKMLKSLP